MVQTELTGEQRQTATWSEIDWTEAVVKRLQGRIYRAAAAGNGRQVKNLQKLLVRSTSAKRLAVRRITQQNAGRNTPGVDGKLTVASGAVWFPAGVTSNVPVVAYMHGTNTTKTTAKKIDPP